MRALTIIRGGLLPILLLTYPATASEHDGSVYPMGAETVLPGLTAAAGQTMFSVFTAFYQVNSLMNSEGHNEVPGFHLDLEAVAFKLDHNWGVRLLGGSLVSEVALPLESESVTTPAGTVSKTGFSNAEIRAASLAYQKGAWHWWYGLDVVPPAFQYRKNDALNIGQHNWAIAPLGAFSWLPNRGQTEVSSRFMYIVNYTDPDTNYRSGNEFIWEFDAMRNITRMIAVGVNGYCYKQTTNDLQNTAIAADGNRGRDVAIGPELRVRVGHEILIAKYQRDTLVENRPSGNMFWFQVGVPLGRHE